MADSKGWIDNNGDVRMFEDEQARTSLSTINDNMCDLDLGTSTTNTTGSAITAGTYFYSNGQLCKAIGDGIDAGATLTLNTNYETVSVSAELSQLNSEMMSTYNLIATTGSETSVSYSADLSQYRFIFLSMGAGIGGNYASNIIPVCLIEPKGNLFARVFDAGSGDFICEGAIAFGLNTLSTTNTSYPANMYGIK